MKIGSWTLQEQNLWELLKISLGCYWILIVAGKSSYVHQVGLIYPVVWFPATSRIMLILTGLRRACLGCVSRQKKAMSWVGVTSMYSQNKFGRMSSAYLPILSTLFNTICQKAIISSLPGAWRSPCSHFGSRDVTSHSLTWITYSIVWIFLSSNVCILLIYLYVIYSLSLLGVSLRELGIPWNACIWSYVEWGNLSSMPCCLP